MTRFPRLAVLLAATALLVVVAPGAAPAADGPIATASKSCGVKDSRSYGTTYVLSINARRVSCRKARERVRAFHKCRQGKRGRCPNLGSWNCSENRQSGAGSFTSDVRCKKGRKVVKHTYTQWT